MRFSHFRTRHLRFRNVAAGIVLLYGAAQLAQLVTSRTPAFFSDGEAGYGDSYVWHTVERYRQTGVIYHDLSASPSVPAIYSPLFYLLLAAGERIAPMGKVFLGPRLVVLAAFLLCVAVTASLARALIPLRRAWIWGGLLPLSVTSSTLI